VFGADLRRRRAELEGRPARPLRRCVADPPYSVEYAERFGTSMIKRNLVMRALQRLASGAHVVWLDQVLSMYRKDSFALEACIRMQKSTKHRFQMINICCRL
jgi:hypothetical protein